MNNDSTDDVELNIVHLQTAGGHVEDDVSHACNATGVNTDNDDDDAVLAAEDELRLRRPRSSVSW